MSALALQLIDEAYEKKSTFLDLGRCGLRGIPEEIKKLSGFLERLNLGVFYYSDGGLEGASNSLSDNNLSSSPRTIELLADFTKLIALDFYLCRLGDEGAKYLSNRHNLTSLDISNNDIGDNGAKYLSKLHNLTSLKISSNKIGDIGAQYLSKLHNLTLLIISRNKIGDNGIKTLVNNLKLLNDFYAVGNPVTKINAELLNDFTALRASLQARNMIDNNRVKMIFIGNSEAGKTSLARWLVQKKYITEKNSTHGIQHWLWETASKKNKLVVNIWDFGGQDFFHATHELFLSNETLFLYLKTSEDVSKMPGQLPDGYWLGYIASRCDPEKTPLWYIQTKTDIENNRHQWLPQVHKGLYRVENQFHISVKKCFEKKPAYKDEFDYFEKKLLHRLRSLAKSEIPEVWAKIRDEFLPIWRQENILFFDAAEFKHNCLQKLAADKQLLKDLEDSWEGVIPYLSRCGELVVFYNQPALEGKVFLGAKQLTDAMYTLLSPQVENTYQGRFSNKHIEETKNGWLLMQVLQAYGLVFEDPNEEGMYVAPQFLPIDPHITHFQKLIKLSYAIKFPDYMSRSVITRFITRYAAQDKESFYWRYGAFFKQEKFDVHCFVRIDAGKQEIYIHVEDVPGKYDVMKELFRFFITAHETASLSSDITGKELPDDKFLIHPRINDENPEIIFSLAEKNNIQLSADAESFAAVTTIKEAIEDKASRIKTENGKYIELTTVLRQLLTGGATPKRIFFSYSKKDAVYREELETHFAALKRSGKIDTWKDIDILPGQEWDKTIKEELNRADIVLLLLSPDFMDTEYIWNTEIKVAVNANKTIIPIYLRPCDWDETEYQLKNVQALPGKSDWIIQNSKPNRDEGYLEVVKGIKKFL